MAEKDGINAEKKQRSKTKEEGEIRGQIDREETGTVEISYGVTIIDREGRGRVIRELRDHKGWE